MVQQFISFVISTNIVSSVLLALGFILAAIGILGPLVSLTIQCVWKYIDSSDVLGDNWFVLYTKGIRKLSFISTCSLVSLNNEYYVRDIIGRWYDASDNQWWGKKYTNAAFSSKKDATAFVSDNSNGYISSIILTVATCWSISIALHYAMWPCIYILTVLCALKALKALRNLQKKGVKMVADLKAHTELKSKDAHKS